MFKSKISLFIRKSNYRTFVYVKFHAIISTHQLPRLFKSDCNSKASFGSLLFLLYIVFFEIKNFLTNLFSLKIIIVVTVLPNFVFSVRLYPRKALYLKITALTVKIIFLNYVMFCLLFGWRRNSSIIISTKKFKKLVCACLKWIKYTTVWELIFGFFFKSIVLLIILNWYWLHDFRDECL